MVKRVKQIPLQLLLRNKSVDEFDWEALEARYEKLPVAARLKITQLTNDYMQMRSRELAAPALSEATNQIEQVQSSANELLNLLKPPSPDAIGRLHGRNLISNSLARMYATDAYNELIARLISLDAACNAAQRAMVAAPADGTSWKNWIAGLLGIAEEFKLRVTISKDGGKRKRDPQTPFVKFVAELQRQIPRQLRWPSSSTEALATAIDRVRAAGRSRNSVGT